VEKISFTYHAEPNYDKNGKYTNEYVLKKSGTVIGVYTIKNKKEIDGLGINDDEILKVLKACVKKNPPKKQKRSLLDILFRRK